MILVRKMLDKSSPIPQVPYPYVDFVTPTWIQGRDTIEVQQGKHVRQEIRKSVCRIECWKEFKAR